MWRWLGVMLLLTGCAAWTGDVYVYDSPEEPPTTPEAPWGWTSLAGFCSSYGCPPPGSWIRRTGPPNLGSFTEPRK